MSWQDELRRLDDELSAGRLSEADYRHRRDELVTEGEAEQRAAAEAERIAAELADRSASEEQPEQTDEPRATPPEQTPEQTPEQIPEPAPPKPPVPPPVPAETTTVIDQPTGVTERIDPGIDDTRYIGRVDADRTQLIGSGRPIGTGQAPPWGAGRQPSPEPNATWMMQGTDVFGAKAPPTKSDRTIPLLIAVMVVLVAAAVGLSYLAWGGDEAESAPAPTRAPATTEPAPEDPLAPGDLGDGARPASLHFPAISGLRLPPEEFGALSQGGADESRLLISTFPEGSATVLIIRTAADSVAVRDSLTALQGPLGWVPRPPQSGVFVLDQPGAIKAFYAGDGIVVRVEMIGSDPTALNTKFADVLNRQLREHPAR